VRIDKAKRLLGYRPAWSLEAGMEMTGRWARWAGLVR
jgi:nucleoside-diphosphate-sugar epimerase